MKNGLPPARLATSREILRQRADGEVAAREGDALLGAQRLQPDSGVARPQLGPLDLLEARPVPEDEHQRNGGEPLEQELEQLAGGGVRPVHVVESDQRRPVAADRDEELPDAGQDLAAPLLVGHARDRG